MYLLKSIVDTNIYSTRNVYVQNSQYETNLEVVRLYEVKPFKVFILANKGLQSIFN